MCIRDRGTSSGVLITAVAHGKYMDVVPVGSVSGSSSTHYCDMYYISTAASRVVYRGYYASPYGGVSMSNASYDFSYPHTYVGSRLAFLCSIPDTSPLLSAGTGKPHDWNQGNFFTPVSYTHLDVYKRQELIFAK